MSHAQVIIILNSTVLTRESVAKSRGEREVEEDKVDNLFDEEHPHFPIDLRNTKMFMIIILFSVEFSFRLRVFVIKPNCCLCLIVCLARKPFRLVCH